MALLETLVDDTTTQSALWTYPAGVSVIGGIMHVPCTNAYPENDSVATYDARGSYLYAKVVPATNGVGANTSLVLVDPNTPGTSMRFDINGGNLSAAMNVGYVDSGAVSIPYDPVAHLYLRLRVDASHQYWDTSPDGSTWTNRRTLTATPPAWMAAVGVHLSNWNTSGTSTDSQFSNINTLSGGGNSGLQTTIAAGNQTTATSGNDTATGITIAQPAHAAGDTLLLAITLRVNGAGTTAGCTYTVPTGWTVVSDITDPGSPPCQQIVATKLGDGLTTNQTWNFTGPGGTTGNGIAAVMKAYSGVLAASPTGGALGQAEASVTAVAPHSTPSVIPTAPNVWAIGVFSNRAGSTWTPDAALTERSDLQNTGSSASMELADSNGPVTAVAHSYTATASATSTVAVSTLVYLQPNITYPAVETLQDPWTFFDTSKWNEQTAAQVSISGGVLSINPVNAGFPNISSLTPWDLTGSFLSTKFTPPGGGAGVEAAMVLASTVGGTDLRWYYTADDNLLHAALFAGYADAAEVKIAYNAASQLFLRISESGGTVSWDVSPDGGAWTSVRTTPTPAWVHSATVIFSADAAVTSGTVRAFFSNLNSTGAAAKAATLNSTFTGTTIDSTTWVVAGPVTQNNDLLVPGDSNYDHVQTVRSYDLTASNFAVDVLPATGTGAETTVACLSGTGGMDLRFTFGTGRLTAEYRGEGGNNLGVDTGTPKFVAWDTTTPARARVRFLEDGTNINWQYSTDGGGTWTTLRSILTSRAAWVINSRLYLGADVPGTSPTPTPPGPTPPTPTPPTPTPPPTPPGGTYTQPGAKPTTFVSVGADLSSNARTVQPWYVGIVCTTFGARPDTSALQKNNELNLDARLVRIPMKWDGSNNRVTGSAGGGPTNFDMKTLVDIYRNAGFHVMGCLGGQSNDWNIATGDARNIVNALGTSNMLYQNSNEPNNAGHSITEVITQAINDYNEGHGVDASFRILGPVWADYSDSANQSYISGVGASKIAGLSWHRYAMGSTYTSFGTAIGSFLTGEAANVAQALSRLTAATGAPKFMSVDEMNYSWISHTLDGHDVSEFYQAQAALWMAASMGYHLLGGAAACQYGTQNGPLGSFIQAGSMTTLGGITPSGVQGDPMPSYFGIKAWTGAKQWSHFKDTMHSTSSSNTDIIAFAVNNEAGGHNLILINQSLGTSYQHIATLTQAAAAMNGYDAYQTVKNNPFNDYTKIASNVAVVGNQVWMNLPAGTITVIVLKP